MESPTSFARRSASMVRDLAVRTPDSRERSADMWRVLAICLVVLGHWFAIAVTYRDGNLSGYNVLGLLTWVDLVTWLFQVMPIFFLVGGYAAGASLASHRARGGDGIGWVLRRTDRLLRPTTALFLVLPVVTAVAVATGVSKKVLGTAVWVATVPLWFLAAYVAFVVRTPWLHALHRWAGLASVHSAAWLLWRVPWIAFCAVVLAVSVALFARIELCRPVLPSVERGLWRDGAIVLGLAAVMAGLVAVGVSGEDDHGATGLPWGALVAYLSGAAVLRVTRTQRLGQIVAARAA